MNLSKYEKMRAAPPEEVARLAQRCERRLRATLHEIIVEAERHGERNGVSGGVRLPQGYQTIIALAKKAL